MKRKRILTVLIVLALVFIWGNSLVSRELSGKISDDILFFLNAAAEKVGLGPDAFTYMTDEDGDGVAEQPTSHLIRKATCTARIRRSVRWYPLRKSRYMRCLRRFCSSGWRAPGKSGFSPPGVSAR